MKFSIERGVLLKTLAHIQSIVERRNTIPILSNVLIKAENGMLTMSTTDLDIQATESVPAEVVENGSSTVSAAMLYDISRKMPDGAMITLTMTDNRLSINAARSRFTLPALPASDFPVIAQGELPNKLQITSEQLYTMLGSTRFAMSKEATRYYLNGIYVHTVDGSLKAVSTDGHRLAMFNINRPETCSDMEGSILPRKCVVELLKVLDDIEDCEIDVSFSKSMMRFSMGTIEFVSKLIDGTFPEYNRVIPKENKRVVIVDALTLLQTIDRVITIAQEKTRIVKLKLSHNKLMVSVISPDNGVANEEIDVEYVADDFEIGFNGSYLMEVLNQNRDGQIKISFGESTGPALLEPQNDNSFTSVLMPARV